MGHSRRNALVVFDQREMPWVVNKLQQLSFRWTAQRSPIFLSYLQTCYLQSDQFWYRQVIEFYLLQKRYEFEVSYGENVYVRRLRRRWTRRGTVGAMWRVWMKRCCWVFPDAIVQFLKKMKGETYKELPFDMWGFFHCDIFTKSPWVSCLHWREV